MVREGGLAGKAIKNGQRADTVGEAQREGGNSLLQMQNALFSARFLWQTLATKRERKGNC